MNQIFIKTLIIIALSLKIGIAYGQEKNADEVTLELEELQEQFKGTDFLQIDELDVPKELLRIEEQLKQNAIDVIITSKTHTPVFAQKQADGYSESYKKFNGLKVQIVPIPKEEDFYSLTLSYYNWTTRKNDKKLRKRISKYNVLNEMRFAVYEILLGEKFVKRNYDKIEKLNFQRIQAIRKVVEKNERDLRKKKKEEKAKEKKVEAQKEEALEKKKVAQAKLDRGEEKDPRRKPKRPGAGPLDDTSTPKSSDIDFESQESQETPELIVNSSLPDQEFSNRKQKSKFKESEEAEVVLQKISKEEESVLVEKPEMVIKDRIPPQDKESTSVKLFDEKTTPRPLVVSEAYAFAHFFEDSTVANGLVKTSTYLKYLGLGATYLNTVKEENERSYKISLRVGVPIRKKNYKFPVYRSIETDFVRNNIFRNFQGIIGLDYSPLYFLGLPGLNQGFQVYENEFYNIKLGLGVSPEFLKKLFHFRLIFLKSLVFKSNLDQEFSENSALLSVFYDYSKKHAFEFVVQRRMFSGAFEATTNRYAFSYIYRFKD